MRGGESENQRARGSGGHLGNPSMETLIGRMGKLRPWERETLPKDTRQASDRGGLHSSSPGSPVRLFPAHLTKDGVKVMVGDEEGN